MQIYSYKGCSACLTVACCSQVCEPYKETVKEKYRLIVESNDISLEEMEHAVFRFLMYEDKVDGYANITKEGKGKLSILLKMTSKVVDRIKLNMVVEKMHREYEHWS